MSKLIKAILIVLVVIILIILTGLGLSIYYFKTLLNQNNIKLPITNEVVDNNLSQEIQTDSKKKLIKPIELPEFTPEQEKILSTLGIDSNKLNEVETQNCIMENIGEERIIEIMSGKENPGIGDILNFKKCF